MATGEVRVPVVPSSPAARDGWSVLVGGEADAARAGQRHGPLLTRDASADPGRRELTGSWDRLRQAVHDERAQVRLTLLLDFTVDDVANGWRVAVGLSTALGLLRPEVEPYSARLAAADRPSESVPIFCMVDGPHGAFCAYPVGHDGWHAETGVDGMRWGEGEQLGTRG